MCFYVGVEGFDCLDRKRRMTPFRSLASITIRQFFSHRRFSMTRLTISLRHVRQAGCLAAMLFLIALCSFPIGAQSVDRAQLFNEILTLQNQLKIATDPVQIATLQGQLNLVE